MTRRRPGEAPAPPHSDAAHRAITAELSRLTLRSRPLERPELLVGWTGLQARMPDLAAALTQHGIRVEDWQAQFAEHYLTWPRQYGKSAAMKRQEPQA